VSSINIDRRRTLLATITLCDFIIVNLVAWMIFLELGSDIPAYFHTYTRIVVALMNVSVLISELFFHSIIHFRLLRLADVSLNVFRLTLTFTCIFAVLTKFVFNDVPTIFSVFFFFSAYLSLMLSRICERGVLNYLRSHGHNVRRVLFVGDDPALVVLHNEMMENPELGYRSLGYYSDATITDCPESLHYLGTLTQMNKKMNENDRSPLSQSGIDIVFCSLPHEMGFEVERVMRSCDKNVARFYYMPRTFADSKMRLGPIRMGEHIFFTNHRSALMQPYNRIIKRSFDLVVSLTACAFLVPLTLVVGAIIKIQSPGPIFFKQQRTGLNGNAFWCYKFRSMHVNKDADCKQATENDPRKFPFGNFIRKYNIDELPQFFNVLIDDMSLVGPRPHMLVHTEMYGKLIDKYMVRHFCKPGITGWAQVTGCRGETKELWQMEERIQRDIWYMEHWNVGLDLKIMAMTFRSFFVHDEHAY